MRAPRFIAGDPLRGLAALGVVFYHAGAIALQSTGHGGPTVDWPRAFGVLGEPLSSGANGVRVFFVLSGYLIARPFLHAYVDGRRGPGIPTYLVKRATRLLPALWVTILVVVALTGAGGGGVLTVLRSMFFVEDWSASPLNGHLGQTSARAARRGA